MRCFIAAPVPGWTNDIAALQARCGFGRSVDEEDLHLTLAFLGDQPDHALDALDDGLRMIHPDLVAIAARELCLLGGTPPRALAVGCTGPTALDGMHRQVLGAVRLAGIGLQHRRFRPHVTFARLPSRYDVGAVTAWMSTQGPLTFPETALSELVLYRSDLHARGARYSALARYPIGAWETDDLDLEWNQTEDL